MAVKKELRAHEQVEYVYVHTYNTSLYFTYFLST